MTTKLKLVQVALIGLSYLTLWVSGLEVKCIISHMTSTQGIVIGTLSTVAKVLIVIYWVLWALLDNVLVKKYYIDAIVVLALMLCVVRLMVLGSLCD